MNLIARAFSVRGMLPDSSKTGDIPPSKVIYGRNFAIAWPATIEGALIALMGAVSTIMVGALGPQAIAAVGLTGQPRMILVTLVSSLCVAVTAITARRKGADDQEGANKCLKQSVAITMAMSVAITLIGYFGARPLMLLAGAQADTIDLSVDYFKIVTLGLVFSNLNMAICSAMRGIGRTQITMLTNIVANIINVALGFLLIQGKFGLPALGVRGAAIAMVIGSAVGSAISLFVVLKKGGYLHLDLFSEWKFDKETVTSLFRVTASSMTEQICLRIGFMVIAVIIARLGTVEFAAYQIVSQVTTLSFTLGDGMAVAGSSLVGQSLGAKRADMAMLHTKTLQRMAFVVSSVMMLIIIIFRYQIAGLFIDKSSPDSAQVIVGTAQCLFMVAFGCHGQNSRTVLSGCLRGAGDVRYVALTSLISVVFIRPVLTWIFVFPLGMSVLGAWVSFVCDQIIRAVLIMRRINQGTWLSVKL